MAEARYLETPGPAVQVCPQYGALSRFFFVPCMCRALGAVTVYCLLDYGHAPGGESVR